jgi:hypothetical protein
LFRNGVTAIAATMITAIAAKGGRLIASSDKPPAIKSVAPVLLRESLTGMSAASIKRIGPSSDS